MPDVFVAQKKKNKPPIFIPPRLEEKLRLERRKGHSRHLRFLSSVAFAPSSLHFEDQEPDEKIIIFVRPHLITNLKWFLLVVLMSLVPPFVFIFLDFSFIPFNFLFVGLLTWYLLTFAFAFERFLVWFFNVEIVTNKRIIDVDIHSLLMRNITQMPIRNIQDITTETAGFMRSLLAFGDVRVQTAGSVPEIKFEAIPYPNKVSQMLNDLWRRP